MTALIFDCDGVLADTERDGHLVAFDETFAEAGLAVRWSEEEYARLLHVGGGKERLRVLRESGDPAVPTEPEAFDAFVRELHRRKTERFVEIVEAGRLPGRPGVRRLVEEALAAGWTLAVASTSAEPSVRAVLRSVVGEEAAARFAVFAGDVVPAKKPAPDIYLHAVEQLGADPQDTVVVEDSAVGAAAAAAAGLRHVVTVSSFTREDAFPAASCVVGSLGDPGDPRDVLVPLADGGPAWPVSLEDLRAVAQGGVRA